MNPSEILRAAPKWSSNASPAATLSRVVAPSWRSANRHSPGLERAEQPGGSGVASVELRGLTKRYGELAVVNDISLTIEHGRLACLLGPSGCGKTTTLRLIAGFVEPSAGEIRVGDRVVSSPARTLPPEQRNMSMIFQS